MSEEKTGGGLSKYFGSLKSLLPQPKGERAKFPSTARRGAGQESRVELERRATAGDECEQAARTPGFLRFKAEMERSIVQAQGALEEYASMGEHEKASREAIRVKAMRVCSQWMDDQIKGGTEARETLEGMRNGN